MREGLQGAEYFCRVLYVQTCKASQNTESLLNKVEFSMGKYVWRTLYTLHCIRDLQVAR